MAFIKGFPQYTFDRKHVLRYTLLYPREMKQNGVNFMMKRRLTEKLRLAKKLIFEEKLTKKICLVIGLLLIPLSLVLQPLFKTMTGPEGKERQAAVLSAEQGPAAQPVEEGRPAGEEGAAAVSRGAEVNRSDLVLLAQVIEGEAADEPYSGKVAVGAVIVNRTKSPDFPKTIPGVVYETDAFESVTNGQYLRPVTNEALQAAAEAVSGADPVGGALYFWNPAKSSSEWVYTRQIVTRIGDHVFAC